MNKKYYIAYDLGLEGWSIWEHDSLESIKDEIQNECRGANFKIFKELELKIVDE